MKELNYCNSIRGNCGNCEIKHPHYCNATFFYNEKGWSKYFILSSDMYYNKKHIEIYIFDILKRGML